MTPYDQPGRPTEQPEGGGQPMGAQQSVSQFQQQQPPSGAQQQPISEMRVSTPTLRWVSIGHPQEQIPLGPDDYVLDTFYNAAIDAWEALVIVQPRESEEDEEEDEEEEEEE